MKLNIHGLQLLLSYPTNPATTCPDMIDGGIPGPGDVSCPV